LIEEFTKKESENEKFRQNVVNGTSEVWGLLKEYNNLPDLRNEKDRIVNGF